MERVFKLPLCVRISGEGRLGSVEAALLRGFPPPGRGPARPKPDENRLRRPKPDEERLQPVGESIGGGDGTPPPTQGGEGEGEALAKGGQRRNREREGIKTTSKGEKKREGGQVK